MDFNKFKLAVASQFELMKRGELFRTEATGDELWETYLSSFPEGTNPIYRERTEHDCSCCKQFIRAVGNMVSIIDGNLVSLWDVTIPSEPAYQVVADSLSKTVKAYPIQNLFLHTEPTAGTDKNFEQLTEGVKTWTHFFINIPRDRVNKYPGAQLGDYRATYDVLLRGITEIDPQAVSTVIELIKQNSLYRGEEHLFALESFQELQRRYNGPLFAWSMVKSLPASVSRIRNTSIGTLLQDLSGGMDLEDAVKRFESVVAPANYKRPKALVTQAMIDKAKQTLQEMGLISALERRYATINDISVNELIFVDRSVSQKDAFDDLALKPIKGPSKVEEVTIEKFIQDILPTTKKLEVLMENKHRSNLVSLIAPADPTANQLFKWGNNFSWSYQGDVTDSIKERVKAAGGSVTGDVCCRLAWDNKDDLDLHMYEPGGHIYFGTRRQRSLNGGVLDLDANGADGLRSDPAENIVYADKGRMLPGQYRLVVNQYSHRDTSNPGFTVEVEVMGEVHTYSFGQHLRTGETKEVATITVSRTGELKVSGGELQSSTRTQKLWGVNTMAYTPVTSIMLSPNFWDGRGVGNKHFFFMLEGCRNEETARGFYNEFLKEELTPHRKVIEMVGSKMRTEESQHQLSGLGFSSTQRNSITCRITGSFTRVIKVNF